MKTLLLTTTLALGLALLPGCGVSVGTSTNGPNVTVHGSGPAIEGSGTIASETRSVGEFHAVRVGHAFTATIEVGTEPSLEISGDDNLLSLVTVAVEDGKLVVGVDQSYTTENRLTLRIGTPTLTELDVGGAAKVAVSNVDADRFLLDAGGASQTTVGGTIGSLSLDTTGSASVDIDGLGGGAVVVDLSGASKARVAGQIAGLSVEISGSSKCEVASVVGGDMVLDLSGASSATVAGTASHVSIQTSGSASADLGALRVQDLTIDLSGASKAKANVTGSIQGRASGASRLTYLGSPATVDVETSPAATVRPE